MLEKTSWAGGMAHSLDLVPESTSRDAFLVLREFVMANDEWLLVGGYRLN